MLDASGSYTAIGGKKLWDKGRLCAEIFPGTKTCIERWPELLEALFASPSDEIGIAHF